MNLVWKIFLSGRKNDLRGLEGVRYRFKPLIFNSPKLGSFGGQKEKVPLILKIFKLSSLPLKCQLIHISLKLVNEDYNGQII
jgi:hypothetical protein